MCQASSPGSFPLYDTSSFPLISQQERSLFGFEEQASLRLHSLFAEGRRSPQCRPVSVTLRHATQVPTDGWKERTQPALSVVC